MNAVIAVLVGSVAGAVVAQFIFYLWYRWWINRDRGDR